MTNSSIVPSIGSRIRKHATSIVLVAAAVGLGVFVWIDRDQPTTEEIEARRTSLLPVFRRHELREIVLEQGTRQITLRRGEDDAIDPTYDLLEPETDASQAVAADHVAVDTLMEALERAAPLRVLGDDIDPASTGLDTPRAVLTVRMKSATYRITLGNEAPTPLGSRFARLDGTGVLVLSQATANALMRPIDSFRPRQIMPYGASELAAMDLQSEHGFVHLERGPWGGFRVQDAPGQPRVSQVVFDRVLRAFADARAEGFLDSSQANHAIEQATRKVSIDLTPKSGSRSELVVGGACPAPADGSYEMPSEALVPPPPKLVVMVRKSPTPAYACVPSSVLDDLEVSPDSLVDRRMMRAMADEIEELQVVRGDVALELVRKGSGWLARKPEERDVQAQDMAGYLASLLAIEGTVHANADEQALGLKPPRGTVTLRHPSLDSIEVPPQVVEVGGEVSTPNGDAIALRRKEDGIILFVPASTAPLLEPSLGRIRSTELLKVNTLRMKRVEVSLADGHKQVLQRKGPGFSLDEPKGYQVDAALAADLFDAVSWVRAERWAADRDDGSFGFNAASSSVHLEFEGDHGEEKRTLLVGDNTTNGRYGRWDPDTGVFVLSQSFDAALRTYAIDRLLFMVDPVEVDSVSVRASDQDVRIENAADVWRSVGGTMHPMQDGSVARIRQALSDLRAEGVVHLGPAVPNQGMSQPLLRLEIQTRPGFSQARQSKKVILVGHGDVWRTTSVYYARREGVDATFAIAQSKVRPLLDAMGVR